MHCLEDYEMAEGGWSRPASVPLPTVWARFKSERRAKDPDDAAPLEFWIQDVTSNLDGVVLEALENRFLAEAALATSTCVLEDPFSVLESRGVWTQMLQQRVSLAAFTGTPSAPRLAGCNVLSVALAKDKHKKLEFEGVALQRIATAVEDVESRCDVFDRYGVSSCLTALGLWVEPDFRGRGVGLALLGARDPLCRALGIPLTATVFTGIASQTLAYRAGFDLLVEVPYDDYKDENGKPFFPNVKSKAIKYMARRIPPS